MYEDKIKYPKWHILYEQSEDRKICIYEENNKFDIYIFYEAIENLTAEQLVEIGTLFINFAHKEI